MTPAEFENKLLAIIDRIGKKALTRIVIETRRSINMNFEQGGRPGWKASQKRGKASGTNTLRISGALQSVQISEDFANNKVVISPNARARAYARIHQEGGTINHPGRKLKFRKNKSGRTVLASSKHKRIVKETQGKPYQIEIPARPYMVIPPEDYSRILNQVARTIKL